MRRSRKHHGLRQLALQWALSNGCDAGAVEVALPGLGVAVDVAACVFPPPRRHRGGLRVGDSMVFECVASRSVLERAAPDEDAAKVRLEQLQRELMAREEALRRDFPTLREGQGLFPEFDAYRYRDAGDDSYNALTEEVDVLSSQVHSNSRLAKLIRSNRANLQYMVAERGMVSLHEVPVGWGLLARSEEGLDLVRRAEWREVSEAVGWALFRGIVLAATRDSARRQRPGE